MVRVVPRSAATLVAGVRRRPARLGRRRPVRRPAARVSAILLHRFDHVDEDGAPQADGARACTGRVYVAAAHVVDIWDDGPSLVPGSHPRAPRTGPRMARLNFANGGFVRVIGDVDDIARLLGFGE
jgi:hypothetical protein